MRALRGRECREEGKEKNEAHGGQHTTTGRSMTSGEMDKREKIVKGMKKDKAGFKKRYGKDADAVMYATATKQAIKQQLAFFHMLAATLFGSLRAPFFALPEC